MVRLRVRQLLLCVIAAALVAGAKPRAQNLSLIAPGATIERVATGFAFLEGPVSDGEDGVFFSDIPNERIHRWTRREGVTTVREPSGRANGLQIDLDGRLLACEMGSRRITSIDTQGHVSVLADTLDGRRFNSPNDLWVDPAGGIYFSDPR